MLGLSNTKSTGLHKLVELFGRILRAIYASCENMEIQVLNFWS